MALSIKAVAVHLTAEEIATAIKSVEAIANRCWRKKIISDQNYKEVLGPHPSVETAKQILLQAVEASIREEEAFFNDFLDILGNELPPQIAKDLITKITYHLEETFEHTNLDQCTEDTQNEPDQKGAVATETSASVPIELSTDSNFSAGKSVDTSSTLCTLRKRRSTPSKQGTHTGLCTHSFPQSAEMEPVQATDETPSLLESLLQQRQGLLRPLQEEKFAQYDKLQAEANNQVLMDENESLNRRLELQSVDYSHTSEEKKKIEKELSDKRLEVDRLLAERDQEVASYQLDLKQLQKQVAENEKE